MIISVSGDLDLASLPQLHSALDDAIHSPARALILDLSHVDSIDSSVLGTLATLDTRVKAANMVCALAVSNDDVRAHLDRGNVSVSAGTATSVESARRRIGATAR